MEEKEVNTRQHFLGDIQELEKAFQKIKLDMAAYMKKEAENSLKNKKIGEAIKQAADEYKNVLKNKNEKIEEYKKIINDLEKEYKNKLKEREKQVVDRLLLEYKNAYDDLENKQKKSEEGHGEEESRTPFKYLKLPKEIQEMTREEIAKNFLKLIEENYTLTKKLSSISKEMSKKEVEFLASEEAFDEKLEKLSLELKQYQERNKGLETILFDFKQNVEKLNNKLDATKQAYEDRIKDLKNMHKKDIEGVETEKTQAQVEQETEFEILKMQFEDAKNMLKERESSEKEFTDKFESKMKKMLRPLFEEFFSEQINQGNITSNLSVEDAYELIKDAISKGDTRDKMLDELTSKGFNKTSIISAIEKIEKEK